MKKKVILASVVSIVVILGGIALAIWWFLGRNTDQELEAAIAQRIQSEKSLGDNLPASIQYSNAVLDALEYQVLSNDTESGTAKVSFTYVDVMALADQYADDEVNADSFYTNCVDLIGQDRAPRITKEIFLHYTLEEMNGQTVYVIESSAEFADALSGGAFSVYMDLLGGAS